jgi:hypothetical protein
LALAHGDHSVLVICGALVTCGYAMSVATYRELEAGTSLPENPPQFFEAMGACLALSDAELLRVLRSYAYEILCLELGEPIARELFPATSPDTYLLTQTGEGTWV